MQLIGSRDDFLHFHSVLCALGAVRHRLHLAVSCHVAWQEALGHASLPSLPVLRHRNYWKYLP